MICELGINCPLLNFLFIWHPVLSIEGPGRQLLWFVHSELSLRLLVFQIHPYFWRVDKVDSSCGGRLQKHPCPPEVLPQDCARAVRRRRQRCPCVHETAYWRCRTPIAFIGYCKRAVVGRGRADTSPSITRSSCGRAMGTIAARRLEQTGATGELPCSLTPQQALDEFLFLITPVPSSTQS